MKTVSWAGMTGTVVVFGMAPASEDGGTSLVSHNYQSFWRQWLRNSNVASGVEPQPRRSQV
ncbi:hypothetical protein [Rothia uropygialis]|uniref:hypothetical protein n=1 Tax=Kocuria sp. 36 TaxID=1415402 RepID=UPI00101BD250|nr:hypothetical protein [Kocuria sp. 36]